MNIRLKPRFFASIAIGNTPFIGLNSPESESSPIKTASSKVLVNAPIEVRIETKIGKSYNAPAFLIFAGARFTVIL